MRRLITAVILFSSCILGFIAKGQSNTISCKYRCHYLYQFASSEQDVTRPEGLRFKRVVLDIGEKHSLFYFRTGYLAQLYVDSLKSCGVHWQTAMDKAILRYGYKGETLAERIYKNFPQKGTLRCITSKMKTFYYDEKMEKPQWKLHSETKQIEGYNCQKATASFKGREWTAWYTSELPFSDGPWKLWGLPGLILEAQDSKGYFHFTFRGIEPIDAKEDPITLVRPLWIKATKEYVKELQTLEKKDMNEMIKRVIGVYAYDENGKKMANPQYTPVNIEE